jgi:hypothetical protein
MATIIAQQLSTGCVPLHASSLLAVAARHGARRSHNQHRVEFVTHGRLEGPNGTRRGARVSGYFRASRASKRECRSPI